MGRSGERLCTEPGQLSTPPPAGHAAEVYYTLAQRWAMAMAGVIHEINGRDARWPGGTPPTEDGRESASTILSEWWDIDDREDAEETLAWLRDEGHRAEYDAIV